MPTARDIKRLNEQFEEFLLRLEFQAVETELTPAKRKKRRRNADACDMAFCKTYFPNIFDKPFSRLHRHIASLTEGNYTISGFPKAGKSAFAYVGKAVKHIALGGRGMLGVGLRTLEATRQRTSALSRIIQRNAMLCYDYDIKVEQDLDGWHIFTSEGGHTQMVAGSVNKGLRNFIDDDFSRFRLFIADDTYDRETSRSSLDNERVEAWVTGEVWRQMEDDGLSLFLGNAINDDCPVVRLRTRHPKRHFSFPILDKEGLPTWPEAYPLEAVERLRDGDDESDGYPFDVWEGEFMDEPAERGEVFQPDWLRFVNVNLIRIVGAVTAIDPAYGESPAACFKSAFTLGLTDTDKEVCLDIYLRGEPYPLFFDYLLGVKAEHAPGAFLFENDFNQWLFAQPYYQAWLRENKVPLPFVLHHAKALKTEYRAADKDSRIMTLVHPHQTGSFHYDARLEGSPDYKRYRKQLLSFGKAGGKLDGPDAAATAGIMLRAYVATGGGALPRAVGSRSHPQPGWLKTGGWFH